MHQKDPGRTGRSPSTEEDVPRSTLQRGPIWDGGDGEQGMEMAAGSAAQEVPCHDRISSSI